MRKKRLEYLPGHFSVKLAHAIHTAAAAESKIGHIECLSIVAGVLPIYLQQFVKRDAKFVLRIVVKILPNELRIKAIEPSGDRGMCRKDVSGPRNCQSEIERLFMILHIAVRPDRKSTRL